MMSRCLPDEDAKYKAQVVTEYRAPLTPDHQRMYIEHGMAWQDGVGALVSCRDPIRAGYPARDPPRLLNATSLATEYS